MVKRVSCRPQKIVGIGTGGWEGGDGGESVPGTEGKRISGIWSMGPMWEWNGIVALAQVVGVKKGKDAEDEQGVLRNGCTWECAAPCEPSVPGISVGRWGAGRGAGKGLEVVVRG